MSAAETVHRLVETAAKQTARRHNGGWDAIEPIGSLATIPGIRSRSSALSRDLSRLITREADNARSGSFCLLGARWPKPLSIPPDPSFWHVDPEGGDLFPQWD